MIRDAAIGTKGKYLDDMLAKQIRILLRRGRDRKQRHCSTHAELRIYHLHHGRTSHTYHQYQVNWV